MVDLVSLPGRTGWDHLSRYDSHGLIYGLNQNNDLLSQNFDLMHILDALQRSQTMKGFTLR
jgi:hypothetical protein